MSRVTYSEGIKTGIRKTYLDIINRGTSQPEVIAVNGGVLNELLHTDEYDAHEAYHVTADGSITRVEH
jgi:hypothetical protein